MLAVRERALELRVLGVSLHDHVDNQTLLQMNGVKDIIAATEESKICWEVVRFVEKRPTSRVTEWYPRERKR